ncbi:MAG: ATP-binding protein [Candidatus Bipolaricaulis sp.]|nr:ATP-binding protein [Candidatus Bipolaricaulis sp.]MDD5219247.1 ATP-binding protein [Candidatus Bipolaricaulis sp.]MDD5646710.1 ATP-binding protein [Candidatus Bipolaricaulis sp.]
MKSPFRRLSLQTKLLASFAIVIVLATIAGYVFINQSVSRAFSEFAVRRLSLEDQLLVQLVANSYERTGSFESIAEILRRGPRGIPFYLVDATRTVIFAPEERAVGKKLDDAQVKKGQPIILSTGETWTALPYPLEPPQRFGVLERGFLATTRRALWLAGCAAAAAGLLLALLLLRQTTSPLRRLEAATRRIAAGHFDERVDLDTPDEIGRLATSFNDMAASLESAELAKQRMIADISHELRTPLSAVRSALEGLRDGLVEPSQETFTALHDRLLLFTRLVNDLHQLTLADAGQLSIRKQPTPIGAILEGIVDTIGAELEDEGISLEEDIDPELPVLSIDRHRIEQVFLNLLSNAIRHTPSGGTIRLLAHRSPSSEVVVSVCDSGPGLPTEELERVFDRFYRGDPARASDGGGAGLGLSIAKVLVEAHAGRIWAENSPAGGACFHVLLPIPPA